MQRIIAVSGVAELQVEKNSSRGITSLYQCRLSTINGQSERKMHTWTNAYSSVMYRSWESEKKNTVEFDCTNFFLVTYPLLNYELKSK